MIKPNATIALIVTFLVLGAFSAFCLFVRRVGGPDESDGSDTESASVFYVSSSTSASSSTNQVDPGVPVAAPVEPLSYPPGVRVSRAPWDSPSREARGVDGGSSESGNGGNGSGGCTERDGCAGPSGAEDGEHAGDRG
ncbi:hypothetical protein GGS24DRAFT_198908 [Hypoxylon argillaceum]|nr:hypothetical protein GGS24DRAFT_198908 [Hypoxylon argillaceum]